MKNNGHSYISHTLRVVQYVPLCRSGIKIRRKLLVHLNNGPSAMEVLNIIVKETPDQFIKISISVLTL